MNKPTLIYDGACGFCQRFVDRWKNRAPGVDFVPYQQADFPQILKEDFEKSVILVEPDGTQNRGAEAVFKTLAFGKKCKPGLWAYRTLPGFKPASEWVYRWVAGHRKLLSKIFPPPRSTVFTRLVFTKILALVYLASFLSLGSQILGLVGSHGIIPIHQLIERAQTQLGPEKFWEFPTLFWISPADWALKGACMAGAVLSVLLFLGVFPRLMLLLLWALYLSLTTVGGLFLSYQWDNLLLETGFAALFSSVWLLRFILFKLIFLSGFVKLISGDLSWHSLKALAFHYHTQPLPTWVAWYAHQLPLWFHQLSTFFVLAVEIIVPFFIFGPRRSRISAAIILTALQILILLTGNYGFFNLLTIALCVTLFDDSSVQTIRHGPGEWIRPLILGLFIWISGSQFLMMAGKSPAPVTQKVLHAISPFRVINHYGLFAVMTKTRNEITLEGSRDGKTWLAYEFKWKPGDLKKPPRFCFPHMPRLDWQMWFAALERPEQNPWLNLFAARLLEGSPDVLALLSKNPFPESPPQFIRASLAEYTFTNFEEKNRDGSWWKKTELGSYFPPVTLHP